MIPLRAFGYRISSGAALEGRMTIRSFASTMVADGAWTGVAALVPIGAALLAVAALVEVGLLLFGLSDLACAACVDPSQAINTAAAAAGAAGAAAAAAGAAVGSGGLGAGPTPPYSYPPDNADDVGDVTPRDLPQPGTDIVDRVRLNPARVWTEDTLNRIWYEHIDHDSRSWDYERHEPKDQPTQGRPMSG